MKPDGPGSDQSRRSFLLAACAAAGGAVWVGWRGSHGVSAGVAAPGGPAPEILIEEFSPKGERLRVVRVAKVLKTDEQWRRQLSPLAFDVTRRFDDEVPFSGAYWNLHEAGIFRCACCDTAVFGSRAKFDSGTGWPSFTEPIAKENILVGRHGALAAAVTCARCDAFLGDLFDDGPPPTGLRYCINSVSLRFVSASSPTSDSVVLAGGCFWGVEEVFEHVKGVRRATAGYAGGEAATAGYETVSTGATGHAESVEVVFDPTEISVDKLLQVFFTVAHDPTQLNRQGPDVGSEYRSVVFFRTEEQRRAVRDRVRALTDAKVYSRPIVTEVVRLPAFHEAEEYHQHYAEKHPNDPYIRFNDLPKVERLRVDFPELYRQT